VLTEEELKAKELKALEPVVKKPRGRPKKVVEVLPSEEIVVV